MPCPQLDMEYLETVAPCGKPNPQRDASPLQTFFALQSRLTNEIFIWLE